MSHPIWTIAEHADGRLRPISFELLAWGRNLADRASSINGQETELCSIVLGPNINRADLQELISFGADKVYFIESPALEHFLVEPFAGAIEHLIRKHRPEVVIAGATTAGRTLMPYLAVRLTTGLTADCTELDIDEETGNLIQTRPAIGGNIMATIVTSRHRPQMATVRPHSLKPPGRNPNSTGEVIKESVPEKCLFTSVEWLGMQGKEKDTVAIQDARKIVSGGRGLKKAENFALIENLAEKLGAAVGASRDVVDRGWIAYPHQVGLSGKTVTPELYVAIGISGAIQHLAGMKTSDCIVAINNDPDAQIFKVADFGVVCDLFEFVPVLIEEIEHRIAKKKGSR